MESYSFSAFITPSEGSSTSLFTGPDMVASFTSVNMNSNIKIHNATIAARGDSFEKVLLGSGYAEEAIDLLLKAVDNRTKERDYFRLYCDLLDNTITEEEFDRIVNEHMDDYVVKEDVRPNLSKLQIALNLSKRIRNIDTVEDLSSLFSFKSNDIKSLINNG